MPRVFDASGFRLRAGALVTDASGRRVLLVRSSSHAGCWVLPAGGLEPGEAPAAAAAREALEEAGAAGRLLPGARASVRDEDKRYVTTVVVVVVVARGGGAGGGEEGGGRVDADGLATAYEDAGSRGRTWVPFAGAPAALAALPHQLAAFAAIAHALAAGGAAGGGAAGGGAAGGAAAGAAAAPPLPLTPETLAAAGAALEGALAAGRLAPGAGACERCSGFAWVALGTRGAGPATLRPAPACPCA